MRAVIATPIGAITVAGDETAVWEISFGGTGDEESPKGAVSLAIRELEAYFTGELQSFSFPVTPQGTPFQRTVWDALTRIPYGGVQTYGELAKRIGKSGAARAVGMAAHRNPIAIVIPCHRLVGKTGLTGYAGGLEIKAWLLAHEGAAQAIPRNPAQPAPDRP